MAVGNFAVPEWMRGKWKSADGYYTFSVSPARIVIHGQLGLSRSSEGMWINLPTPFNCPTKQFQLQSETTIGNMMYRLFTTGGTLEVTDLEDDTLKVTINQKGTLFKRVSS